ncbi:MoaD/ThiS family protein [Thermococcus sp. M39]|uniref:MoaD/ThiS family protein n=1 Tax=unclassified Thermococcus TaxID=2627626 RepID=UPI00143BCEEA|nr:MULTISPECIES: MoaD/ThiS family protein [unclassified Thermococcus]NJE07489.1 MoaD/ThiS family protein [Thermococcus sp. M39]NJE13859.1 MoaD/ThiS family protein [Thermococcus sp. LS2]
MKVYVKFIGPLRQQVEVPEFWVFLKPDSTISDLLDELEKNRGIKIDPQDRNVVILVNGRSIEFLERLNTKLKDLDKIVIMPVAAGG